MIQSLHILRKDIRHLWPDLSVYAAILIAYGIVIPMEWSGADAANVALHIFIGLLRILIPLLWLVMIARLIHDESLVGDQQFWITRPYNWISLVAAKLLFIALGLVLPFTLMQWAMLLQAGLNPIHSLPGQLLTLLYIALIAWLPFTAVASVTSTVQRVLMALLAAVIFLGASLAFLGNASGPRTPLPYGMPTFLVVLAILLVSTLLFQYARRHTLLSRLALAATTVLIVVLFMALIEAEIPGLGNSLTRHHYPLSTDSSLHLAYDSSVTPPTEKGDQLRIGKLTAIRLPITMQGLNPSAQLDEQTVSFTIDAPGYHYASPWRPAGFQDGYLVLFIPQKVVDKIHGANVAIHLEVAAQRLLPGTPQTVTAASDFAVPGDGTCHLLSLGAGNNGSCRFPFQIASRTIISAPVVSGSCTNPGPNHPGSELLNARLANLRADPTIEVPLRLGGTLCPGTQLTFTPYHPADRFRLELNVPSISLDHYLWR